MYFFHKSHWFIAEIYPINLCVFITISVHCVFYDNVKISLWCPYHILVKEFLIRLMIDPGIFPSSKELGKNKTFDVRMGNFTSHNLLKFIYVLNKEYTVSVVIRSSYFDWSFFIFLIKLLFFRFSSFHLISTYQVSSAKLGSQSAQRMKILLPRPVSIIWTYY